MIARQLWEIAHELAQRGQAIAAGEMLWGAANRILLAVNLYLRPVQPAGNARHNASLTAPPYHNNRRASRASSATHPPIITNSTA